MAKMLGGWGATVPATEEIKVFTNMMMNISEVKTGKTYKEFNAVESRMQVVAGFNYLIKVHVGGDDYVHLKIYLSPLLGDKITIEFMGAKGGFKKADPLNPAEITH